MKRLVLAVVLTVFVSVSTLSGNIPTGDAVPPPPPPPLPDATVWLTQVVLAVTSLARP